MNNRDQVEELKSTFPFNFLYLLSGIIIKGGILLAKKIIGSDLVDDIVFKFKGKETELNTEVINEKPRALSKRDELNPFITGWSHRYNKKVETSELYEPIYNTLVLGTTGSGKSTLIERMIFDKMLLSESIMFLDPKGDIELFRRLRKLAVACGYKIIAVGSTNFIDDNNNPSPEDFPTYVDYVADCLTSHKKLSIFNDKDRYSASEKIYKSLDWSEQFYSNLSMDVLRKTILNLKNDDFDLKDVLDKIDPTDKNTLGLFTQLSNITGTKLYGDIFSRDGINFQQIRDEKTFVYVGLDSQSYPEQSKFLGRLLMWELAGQSGVYNKLLKKPKHDLAVFVDETKSIGTKDLIFLVDKIRSAKINMTFCAQSVSNLDAIGGQEFRDQFISVMNNFFVGHMHDTVGPNVLAAVIGTKYSQKMTFQIDSDTETGKGSARDAFEYHVNPQIFRDLKIGQFVTTSKVIKNNWDIISLYKRDYVKTLPKHIVRANLKYQINKTAIKSEDDKFIHKTDVIIETEEVQ